MKTFGVGGKAWEFLNQVLELVILSAFWIILCIPLIPAGAATAALMETADRHFAQQNGSLLGSFLEALRKNFRQATVCWGLNLVCLLVLWADMRLLESMDGLPFVVLTPIFIGLMLYVVTVFLWQMSYIAHYADSLRNVIRNSLFVSLAKPLRTAVVMLIVLGTGILFEKMHFVTIILPGIALWQTDRIFNSVFETIKGNHNQ